MSVMARADRRAMRYTHEGQWRHEAMVRKPTGALHIQTLHLLTALLYLNGGCGALFPDESAAQISPVVVSDIAGEVASDGVAGRDDALVLDDVAGRADTGATADAINADGEATDSNGDDAGTRPPALADTQSSDASSKPNWPKALRGTWLVGWLGGLNHFTWIKFDGDGDAGKALFNPGKNLTANAPIWDCGGQGSWMMTAKPNTVALTFPKACNLPLAVITFENMSAVTTWPKAALLTASITLLNSQGTTEKLAGLKFADDACDASLTSCKDVFKE